MAEGRKNIQSTFQRIILIEQKEMNAERTYFSKFSKVNIPDYEQNAL